MLVFNSITCDYNRIDQSSEGQLLRTAYFLGDKLIVSGYLHNYIGFEHHQTNNPIHHKDQLLWWYAKASGNPHYVEEVERFLQTMKQARKGLKHEPSAIIIARKRLEKSYDKLYETAVQYFIDHYQRMGFTGLLPLVEEEVIDLVGKADELNGKESDLQMPYSKILSRKWNEADEVYIFSHPFWEYAAARPGLLATADESDEDTRVITFRLPDLPRLNQFSTAELKLIRHEVFAPLSILRKTIEDWSAKLMKEDFSATESNTYEQYFADEIEPEISWLQDNINASTLLQQSKEARKGLIGTENYLAVTSAKTVWDYMEWGGLVPKESMHIFEQNLPAGCTGDKAMLVLLSMPFDETVEGEEEDDKKSLKL